MVLRSGQTIFRHHLRAAMMESELASTAQVSAPKVPAALSAHSRTLNAAQRRSERYRTFPSQA